VIKSFKDTDTKQLFEGEPVKRWKHIEPVARRKLVMIDAAVKLEDLKVPPGNKLHKLDKGSYRAIWNSDKRSVSRLFRVARRRRTLCGDYRLSLEGIMTKLKPIHPGEILREEFMVPFELNPNKLALALRVAAPNVYDIIHERRGISSEMSLRLARYFRTTPEFWINLQAHYDLAVSRQEVESKINHEVAPMTTNA